MSIPRDPYLGEPGYPGPWTTKQPREGLRDLDEARIVSLAPDVCWTPVGSSVVAIPYPIVDFCGHDQNYTPSVRFTGKKAMVMRSCTTHVHGDKPGVKKGVNSGTVESICEPVGHADQVRAEGSYVIRHLDRFKMNNGNTEGEAIFVRDTSTYDPPKDDDPVPGSLRWQSGSDDGKVMSDASPEPLIMGAQYAQAAPATLPQVSPQPSAPPLPKPPGQVIRPDVPQWRRPPPTPEVPVGKWLTRLGKFGRVAGPVAAFVAGMWPTSTAMPWHDEMPQDDFERQLFRKARELEDQGVDADAIYDWFADERLHHQRRLKEEVKDDPKATPAPKNVRIEERDEYRKKCQVDSYGKMKNICKQYEMQAHHIIPDWTLRYGARNDNNKRIPGLPNLNEGMSICVIGNAAMQDTEHNEAHLGDRDIESIGKTSAPPGTASLSQVLEKSISAMIKARPDCADEILKAVSKQFGSKDGDKILRAVKDIKKNPLDPDTISALKSGASYPWKKGGL